MFSRGRRVCNGTVCRAGATLVLSVVVPTAQNSGGRIGFFPVRFASRASS